MSGTQEEKGEMEMSQDQGKEQESSARIVITKSGQSPKRPVYVPTDCTFLQLQRMEKGRSRFLLNIGGTKFETSVPTMEAIST